MLHDTWKNLKDATYILSKVLSGIIHNRNSHYEYDMKTTNLKLFKNYLVDDFK